MSSDKQAVERDLPDLVLFLIATGLPICEALAVQWAELAQMRAQWRYGGPSYGRALAGVIKPSPKSAAGRRILEVPFWLMMLRRRQPDDVSGDELARQVFRARARL